MVTALRSPGGSKPLSAVAQLHGPVVLPGCGDWTQQERPAEVNAAFSTSSLASTARHHNDAPQNPPGGHRPDRAGAAAHAHVAANLDRFAFTDGFAMFKKGFQRTAVTTQGTACTPSSP
ncbi:hypothetical protein [Streptomyces sp. NPDC050287]|uniref:hypothetical protein n=1 Tax=Streptomyces sp. NPDC050287 TaxID=3365608 RepID=UPI003790AB59